MSTRKQVIKDNGNSDSQESLDFAQKYLTDLQTATTLKAQLNNAVSAQDFTDDWGTYNVRFGLPDGKEFWFSGFNIGYKGTGPTYLVKVLKKIHWDINPEVIFINEKLEVTRAIGPTDEKKKPKRKKKEDEE